MVEWLAFLHSVWKLRAQFSVSKLTVLNMAVLNMARPRRKSGIVLETGHDHFLSLHIVLNVLFTNNANDGVNKSISLLKSFKKVD